MKTDHRFDTLVESYLCLNVGNFHLKSFFGVQVDEGLVLSGSCIVQKIECDGT